jgi:putative transposase
MSRPLRIEYPGAVYHITTRGNARKRIFKDANDRETFLEVLGMVVKKYNWLCHAYCLMDNHFHLIIETPEGNLSRGMRQLNGMYAQTYNRRHKRVGHIFQGRFKAILVEKESYLLELCRYVVLNPARAGAVERPAEWKWSSYRATAGIGKPLSLLTVDWILGQFGDNRGQALRRYKEFIVAGLKAKSPWKDLKGQILLGKEGFLSKFKELIANKESISEIPKHQRYLGRPALSALFAEKGMLKRKKMMHQSHVKYGYTLKEIADHLGIHYTTVSKAVRALEK